GSGHRDDASCSSRDAFGLPRDAARDASGRRLADVATHAASGPRAGTAPTAGDYGTPDASPAGMYVDNRVLLRIGPERKRQDLRIGVAANQSRYLSARRDRCREAD